MLRWTQEELGIFALFSGRCALNKAHKAVTLHEIVPKSLAPKTWKDPMNRIPLCAECHRKVHDEGSVKYRIIFTKIRRGIKNTYKDRGCVENATD